MPQPYVPLPLTAEIQLVYAQQGQRLENTLYFAGAAAWDESSLSDLAIDCRDWWIANMSANVGDYCELVLVIATDKATETGMSIELPVSPPEPGLYTTGVAVPNNATLAITFVTALRGRSYRGRNYLVGIKTGMFGAGPNTYNSTFTNNVLGDYGALSTGVTTNGATHVVASRFHNGARRVTGVVTPVINYKTDGIADSQRRRLPGRGV